jgi:hypothetical protein
MILKWASLLGVALVLALVLNFGLSKPKPADAFIHEIIAAMCRSGGEEVIPPGQIRDGQSFIRALQASGFITSINVVSGVTTITFNPNAPNSKFMSAGFNLPLDTNGDGTIDLVLSPLVVPNPAFPAHSHCANLQP